MRPATIALCGVLVSAAACPLYLVGTAGHAIHNGDEAVYAQMAREMVQSGNWRDLTWQGEVLFPRPPMAVWIVALAQKWLGPDARSLRWPLALAVALEG